MATVRVGTRVPVHLEPLAAGSCSSAQVALKTRPHLPSGRHSYGHPSPWKNPLARGHLQSGKVTRSISYPKKQCYPLPINECDKKDTFLSNARAAHQALKDHKGDQEEQQHTVHNDGFGNRQRYMKKISMRTGGFHTRPPPVHHYSHKVYKPVVVRPPATIHHIRAAFSGRGRLQVLCVKPMLIQIDGFFAQSRCERVVEYANQLNAFSYDNANVESGDRKARTSTGMWMSETSHLEHPDIKHINESLADLVGFPEKNCEPLHTVKYVGGQEYWPHSDFIEQQKDMPCGGRVATMLVYLTECADGGATQFPLLNITVHPKPGTVLLWYNVLPTSDAKQVSVDERMLHAGMPVGPSGEKMIMCKWVHPFEFTH